MLYLEDYLEMIEHLPQELRDRFTEMRELDLSVQNNIDELEKRVKILFSDCKRYPGDLPPSTDVEFQSILKEYYSTLEEADEKVHLANQMYELVDKYLRRLDTELHKFKCELEADNKGITELLEKRSLELDSPISAAVVTSHQQKENRYESSSYRYRPRSEKRRDNNTSSNLSSPFSTEKRSSSSAVTLVDGRHVNASNANATGPTSQSTISYNLGHIGAGPAIAAAASQAIAATQQMQQGRRTASLKASYEAINTGVHVTEFGIGRELAGAAQTAIQAIQQDHHNNKKKQKKWSSSSSSAMNGGVSGTAINSNSIGNHSGSSSNSSQIQTMMNNSSYSGSIATSNANSSTSSHSNSGASSTNTHSSGHHGNGVAAAAAESPLVDNSSAQGEVTDGEWSYDPNEPRYCLCNQVSYGDMVACDNEDCPSEWFHYPCVGITAPPKGKWYCPQCTASMRRRGGRKN